LPANLHFPKPPSTRNNRRKLHRQRLSRASRLATSALSLANSSVRTRIQSAERNWRPANDRSQLSLDAPIPVSRRRCSSTKVWAIYSSSASRAISSTIMSSAASSMRSITWALNSSSFWATNAAARSRRSSEPVLKKEVEARAITVLGAYYDLATGAVAFTEEKKD